MGAIGNMTFGIGFKIKANEIFKAQKEVDKLKGNTKSAGDAAEKASSKFSGLGKTLGIVGGIAGGLVVAGVTAVGVAAWKAGQQSEESFRIIRTGTGATGKQLDDIMASYRKLGSQVPDDLSTVASVMADVNTRTGATGDILEDISGKVLSLTAIAGADAGNMVTTSTRLMGDWGISVDKGGETLDKLFYISQSTGVGMETLSEKLTTFGGPLRQMGFDFDTSAAMLGKWEKEGVNAELVAGSLRIALGKMAKAGVKDTKKGLDTVINKIKNAGTVGEATALAMEAFGAKAGPDMAAAVREGRFELGELVDGMKNSKGIIDENYAATETFGDKVATLKNKIIIGLSPLGDKIMVMVEKAFPFILKFFDDLAKGFENAMPYIESFASFLGAGLEATIDGVGKAIGFVKDNLDYIVPALGAFALAVGVQLIPSLIKMIPTLWASATAGWAAMAPWLLVIGIAAAVAAAVLGIIYVIKNWGKITDWLGKRWTQFKTWTINIFNSFIGFFKKWGLNILMVLTGPIGILIVLIIKNWDTIKSVTVSVFTGIWDWLKSIWGSISSSVSGAVSGIWGAITRAWDNIKNAIGTAMGLIKETISNAWNDVVSALSGLGDRIGAKFTGIWGAVKQTFADAINWIIEKFNNMIDKMNSLSITNPFTGKEIGVNIPHIPTVDGSHKNGLEKVPFNGYVAELHKDERVLTAKENRAYTPESSPARPARSANSKHEISLKVDLSGAAGVSNVSGADEKRMRQMLQDELQKALRIMNLEALPDG